MCETMITIGQDGQARPEVVFSCDELSGLESLVRQANESLNSISSLVLSLDDVVQDTPVKVTDAGNDIEISRLCGEQMQDLLQRVRVLEDVLYDRCV
ncbi:MAG: hypothetical protein HW380_2049 [Magnetococcales bacterium]|nr:hypothetical protein [Magnetococcales bacterium]HIJ86027.1 hypothetical protein [Magnetococcales bacterium]